MLTGTGRNTMATTTKTKPVKCSPRKPKKMIKESKPMDFDFERKSHQMFKKFLDAANTPTVEEKDSPYENLRAYGVTQPIQLRKSKSAEMPMDGDSIENYDFLLSADNKVGGGDRKAAKKSKKKNADTKNKKLEQLTKVKKLKKSPSVLAATEQSPSRDRSRAKDNSGMKKVYYEKDDDGNTKPVSKIKMPQACVDKGSIKNNKGKDKNVVSREEKKVVTETLTTPPVTLQPTKALVTKPTKQSNKNVKSRQQQSVPQQNVPQQNIPRQSAPQQTVQQQSVPQQNVQQQNVQQQNVPKQSVPQQSVPQQSVPQQNVLQQSVPQQSDPQQSVPQQSVLQQNVQQQSVQQQSVPQQSVQQQSVPQQIVPQQNVPQQNVPQQTVQQQNAPQQFLQQQRVQQQGVQQSFQQQRPQQQQNLQQRNAQLQIQQNQALQQQNQEKYQQYQQYYAQQYLRNYVLQYYKKKYLEKYQQQQQQQLQQLQQNNYLQQNQIQQQAQILAQQQRAQEIKKNKSKQIYERALVAQEAKERQPIKRQSLENIRSPYQQRQHPVMAAWSSGDGFYNRPRPQRKKTARNNFNQSVALSTLLLFLFLSIMSAWLFNMEKKSRVSPAVPTFEAPVNGIIDPTILNKPQVGLDQIATAVHVGMPVSVKSEPNEHMASVGSGLREETLFKISPLSLW